MVRANLQLVYRERQNKNSRLPLSFRASRARTLESLDIYHHCTQPRSALFTHRHPQPYRHSFVGVGCTKSSNYSQNIRFSSASLRQQSDGECPTSELIAPHSNRNSKHMGIVTPSVIELVVVDGLAANGLFDSQAALLHTTLA